MDEDIRSALYVTAGVLAVAFITLNHEASRVAYNLFHSPLLWGFLVLLAIVLVLLWVSHLFEALTDWLQDWWDNLPFWRSEARIVDDKEEHVTVYWFAILVSVSIIVAIVAIVAFFEIF